MTTHGDHKPHRAVEVQALAPAYPSWPAHPHTSGAPPCFESRASGPLLEPLTARKLQQQFFSGLAAYHRETGMEYKLLL